MRGAKLLSALGIALLFSCGALAQTSSRTAYRIQSGAALPATCSPSFGDVFFLTVAPIGFYNCTASNTWNTMAITTYTVEFNNGNSGAADTIDWNLGNKQRSTLTDNVTYTFTDPPGPANLLLFIKQDGGGTNTVTWPANVKWAGGTAPTITSAASAEDIISCYFNGTNYYCAEVQNLQ